MTSFQYQNSNSPYLSVAISNHEGLEPKMSIPALASEILALKNIDGLSFSKIAKHMNAEHGLEMTKDRAQKLYNKYKGHISTDAYDKLADEFLLGPVRRKVIVTADWHGDPDLGLLEMIVSEMPDLVVIAGDLYDNYAFSDHPYNDMSRQTTYENEKAKVRGGVSYLRHNLPEAEIIIIYGNHDKWVQRQAAKIFKSNMSLVKDPIEEAIKGIERVSIVGLDLHVTYPNGDKTALAQSQYMVMIGDALISHANFSGANPGDASKKLKKWLDNWRRYLELGEIALTVQAHTHKMFMAEQEGGWLVQVEPGIGGKPGIQQYALGYDLKWSPGPVGACQFIQEDTNGDGHFMTIRSSVNLLRPYR